MSRWLMKHHQIDLGPQDLRVRIMPYDTFAPFGKDAYDWISQFPTSTAYEIARAVRFMVPKDPVLMSDEELENSRKDFVEPTMETCPYGTSVREVFSKLQEAGLLKDGNGRKHGGPHRGKPDIGLLGALALSEDGLVDGMFIPRRNVRRNKSTERRWARWFNAFCEKNDLDRDEAFRRIMELAIRQLGEDDEADDTPAAA
jgi:hypothetical protein